MNDLTNLSLFSGIGGLDLAAEWAGFRTVGQCEWADYPRAVAGMRGVQPDAEQAACHSGGSPGTEAEGIRQCAT